MRWYFDFVSPYAYLQSARLGELSAIEPVECVPVLFAGLLNHWGHTGPAELAPKRQWTFEHITWLAHRDGIALRLPAHHPFNPLPLLRLSHLLGNRPEVVQRLFTFVWVEGQVPQSETTFHALLAELGVDAKDLDTESARQAIRANTDDAIARGIFGVPSVSRDGQNFWGYDATDMVLAQAGAMTDGEIAYPAAAIAAANSLAHGPARPRRSTNEAPEQAVAAAAVAAPHPASAAIELAPRIAYLPADLAEPADLVASIRERRGGQLIELDRLLLYSPPLARGWNHLLGTIRTQLNVSTKLRELAMCTVAVINRAEYEFFQHAPLFIAAGGTTAQVRALRNPELARRDTRTFDTTERAALALCIEMTRDVQVSDETFAQAHDLLGDRDTVELIATIGAYNLVSRFLVALNVHPQPEKANEAG